MGRCRMRWKRFLVGLLCIGTAVCASAQSVPAGLRVDESSCQIHSSDSAITPILAIQNSGSETNALIRVELLNPADEVRATGEVNAHLHPGVNRVSAPFAGWDQKSSEWNDTIWYRVRYRVMPRGGKAVAEGVLALAATADGVFDLRVVAPR